MTLPGIERGSVHPVAYLLDWERVNSPLGWCLIRARLEAGPQFIGSHNTASLGQGSGHVASIPPAPLSHRPKDTIKFSQKLWSWICHTTAFGVISLNIFPTVVSEEIHFYISGRIFCCTYLWHDWVYSEVFSMSQEAARGSTPAAHMTAATDLIIVYRCHSYGLWCLTDLLVHTDVSEKPFSHYPEALETTQRPIYRKYILTSSPICLRVQSCFSQVSRLNFCVHFSTLPSILHVGTISSHYYILNSTNYEARIRATRFAVKDRTEYQKRTRETVLSGNFIPGKTART